MSLLSEAKTEPTREHRFFVFHPVEGKYYYFTSEEDQHQGFQEILEDCKHDGIWDEEAERIMMGAITHLSQRSSVQSIPVREDFDSDEAFQLAMDEWPNPDVDEVFIIEPLPILGKEGESVLEALVKIANPPSIRIAETDAGIETGENPNNDDIQREMDAHIYKLYQKISNQQIEISRLQYQGIQDFRKISTLKNEIMELENELSSVDKKRNQALEQLIAMTVFVNISRILSGETLLSHHYFVSCLLRVPAFKPLVNDIVSRAIVTKTGVIDDPVFFWADINEHVITNFQYFMSNSPLWKMMYFDNLNFPRIREYSDFARFTIECAKFWLPDTYEHYKEKLDNFSIPEDLENSPKYSFFD